MTQERLQELATLTVEQDLAKNINLNELVTSLTNMKLRKIECKM